MAKFTPGPWAVSEDPREGMEWNAHIVLASDYEQRICFMAHGGNNREEEFALNASLIAAAPDLYEAVTFVLERIADKERGPRDLYPAFGLDSRRAIDMCRAAVAKAGGQS